MKAWFEVGATIEAPTMSIRLRCVDTADPDYQKINNMDSKALWETQVDAPIEHPGRYLSRFCFEMLIPRNTRCTTSFGFKRGIVWQLRLRARTRSVDFPQELVMPVIASDAPDQLMNTLSQPFDP